jgi:precorrin-2 dehydrogenase / sirohydrochlorin ferrochelatase
MNFRYPIFLDVEGKRCLVTGAGSEIAAKIRTLASRGARVTYVNPAAEDAIAALAAEGRIVWHARRFESADLNGCLLVITDHKDNAEIFRLAEERNVSCNAVDDPAHCRFSFGSVVSRDDLTVAISTNGVAPALAVRLRQRLERELGEEYGQFLAMLGELRPEITRSLPDFERRKALWYRMIDSEALDALRQGRPQEARQLLRRLLEEAKQEAAPDRVKDRAET